MDYLKELHKARTLRDVALILGVQPKTVLYVLYKRPEAQKYHSFEISKRSGGVREINAPEPRLKMLQRRLANVLYSCIAEAEKNNPPRRPLSHGFERSKPPRSIFTNASVHKNRRYVLNLDLEDFFPSFNFGRVRGFIIKDKRFELNEKIATVIAQITCFRNELPQGSPYSPVISNPLGHPLDVRLARLAKKNKLTYSRYADDLTFSTNKKDFPAAIAEPIPENSPRWRVGPALKKQIENAGFKVNHSKTQMQWRGSRQVTTGLIVNKKVNVKSEYYRTARAMCHKLFSTGEYYISDPDLPIANLNRIEGIVNHVYYIKERSGTKSESEENKKNLTLGIEKLYGKFLFYKYFVSLEKPLIVTEGKTDPIYLRAAMKKLSGQYPQLGTFENGQFSSRVNFLKYSDVIGKMLELRGGASSFSKLIHPYETNLKNFRFKPLRHPVIVLIDNDDGATSIFRTIKNDFDISISHETTESFYHLRHNLYLVKTPEGGKPKKFMSDIEDLFDEQWLKKKVDGKSFDRSNKHSGENKYGKQIFATRIILPNIDKIDFSRFTKLLDRLVEVLDHYKAP